MILAQPYTSATLERASLFPQSPFPNFPIYPGPIVIKRITSVIYECSLQASVFASGKPFQPSLMFVGKAKNLP